MKGYIMPALGDATEVVDARVDSFSATMEIYLRVEIDGRSGGVL
jgi:hypothetical protein